MSLPNTPRITWNSGASVFVPTLPARYWTPIDTTEGGVRISAGGIPASYIVRRDVLIDVPLRFTEAEWGTVLALVAWGQSARTLIWYPDTAVLTGFIVYLEAPAAGQRFAPSRAGEYPKVFELTLTFRGAGTAPWTPYFP